MTTNNAINISSQGTVYFNGTGTFSGVDGSTSGFLLTSNGTGVAPSFQASTAGKTITGNTGGALSPTAGNWNIVTSNSTPVFAGATSTLTLDFNLTNLVLGSSLPSLTSGTTNTGVGSNVLNAVTSGSGNVVMGNAASDSTTTGSFNISLGVNSLTANVSSSSNTACGFSSLSSLVSGTGKNVSIGINSSGSLGTGTDNIVVGSDSGSAFQSSESSNIIIGNAGVISESNAIRIGTAGSGTAQQNKAFVAGITGVTVAASAPIGVNTNGQLSSLGFGTSGQVLTSNGAGSSPTFQAAGSPSLTTANQTVSSGSAVSVSTNTATNIVTLAIPSAGTWMVTGFPFLQGAITITDIQTWSLSTTSATHGTLGDNSLNTVFSSAQFSSTKPSVVIPDFLITLGAAGNVYLVVTAIFSAGTLSGFGRITALKIS